MFTFTTMLEDDAGVERGLRGPERNDLHRHRQSQIES